MTSCRSLLISKRYWAMIDPGNLCKRTNRWINYSYNDKSLHGTTGKNHAEDVILPKNPRKVLPHIWVRTFRKTFERSPKE